MDVEASLFDRSLFDLSDEDAGDLGTTGAGAPTGLALGGLVRHRLARGAWVDLLPDWLTGGELLERLLEDVPWRAERRPMYDRVVSVPRLLCHYAEGERLPHPLLETVRDALNERYEPEIGEPLVSAGLCLYRDGTDSVAWHGDTIGRGRTTDTVVAILSLGSPREFLLRPRGGGAVARAIAGADLPPARPDAAGVRAAGHDGGRGPSSSTRPLHGRGPAEGARAVSGTGTIRHTLRHGDLVVMGGSCQRTWEHAVPKTTRTVGPRVSVQFRARGVS